MLANTATLPAIGTQLNSLVTFATAPSAASLSSAWQMVRRDVFSANTHGSSEIQDFSNSPCSAGQLTAFRDMMLGKARDVMDARLVNYAEEKGRFSYCEYEMPEFFEMLNVVMRARALGVVSRQPVDVLEGFYKKSRITPRTKRVANTGALFYRARLRALFERRRELKSLAGGNGVRSAGTEISPREIPEDLVREINIMQLKAGASILGMAAVAAALLGGATYVVCPDLTNPFVPPVWSSPVLYLLKGWNHLHRKILAEKF